MTRVIELSAQTLELELRGTGAAAEPPLLLDLWGPDCAPCQRLAPLLEQLARQYGARLRVAKLDVSQAPEMARRLAVRAVPTLLLLRNGQELDRRQGFAGLRELRHWLAGFDVQPPGELPPGDADHAHGAFYGDAQLRDFLLQRLVAGIAQRSEQERQRQQWPGGWGSLPGALVRHDDAAVFERLTGLPVPMLGLLDLVGGWNCLPAEQVEHLLRAIPLGRSLHGLPLRLLQDWLGDPAEDWPAFLADPALDALRLQWLQVSDCAAGDSAAGAASAWSSLRERLTALDTEHEEPARLAQDFFIELLAALSPPPPHFASFWSQALPRLASIVLMNQTRLAAGWSHADIGMEVVLHRWFSARAAQEPGGEFTPERLQQTRQQWVREQPDYMAKYSAFHSATGTQLLNARLAALRARLVALLAA
jgi:thioredoxin 1